MIKTPRIRKNTVKIIEKYNNYIKTDLGLLKINFSHIENIKTHPSIRISNFFHIFGFLIESCTRHEI